MSFKDRWHREKAQKAARKNAWRGSPESMRVGIAWYSEDEWNKLTEVVPDRDELDGSYPEWEKNAHQALQRLRNEGFAAMPVMVDVAELKVWCEVEGRPVDSAARAYYVSHLLKLHDGGTEP